MNFGNWVTWLFYAFFMVVYFMMIFRVISDLFRRDDIGGWGKAGWIIVLLFIPLLTMLIYVISQGGQMTQRDRAQYGGPSVSEQDQIRAAAGGAGSTTNQIKDAHLLLQTGAITQAEYDAIKAKALA